MMVFIDSQLLLVMKNKWWMEYFKVQTQNINEPIKIPKISKLLKIQYEIASEKIIIKKGYYWIKNLNLITSDKIIPLNIYHQWDYENSAHGFITNNPDNFKTYSIAHVRNQGEKIFVGVITEEGKQDLINYEEYSIYIFYINN